MPWKEDTFVLLLIIIPDRIKDHSERIETLFTVSHLSEESVHSDDNAFLFN
jgi:hypothetical protein